MGIRADAKIWKVSIQDESSRKYCFAEGEVRIGWGDTGDLSDPQSRLGSYFLGLGSNDRHTLINFSEEMQKGDIVLCLKNQNEISAVGVITGDYEFSTQTPSLVRDDYCHFRKATWLLKDVSFNILNINQNVTLTLKTVYHLFRFDWPTLEKELERQGYVIPSHNAALKNNPNSEKLPYVLIIDEINRGNISRIFGELITLIEDSKREGAAEALSVVLPYSKAAFSVPDNVYIIGTMNSSDRSLTGLDIALRRRFTFTEMPPDLRPLAEVEVDGVDIQRLLKVINQRIEILLDRDHCIGHAYFMPLVHTPSLTLLAGIFQQKIIPLLQEYFFDDWQRIDWVLGQNGMLEKQYKDDGALRALFPENALPAIQNNVWVINPKSFGNIQSYQQCYAKAAG